MANPALIDELEKQFRDNPRRVFARLANEYRKGGDFMRAIEICHAHVPQQPGYISGHIVLGQALYDAGELDQAQQTFEAALALDPENLIALRQLGDISRSRRDYGDARVWYTRLLEVDPQNEEIVAQLGELALVESAPGARNGDPAPAPDAQLDESGSSVAVVEDAEQDAVAVAEDEAPSALDPVVVDEEKAEEMSQEDAPVDETRRDDAPRMEAPPIEPSAEPVNGLVGNGADSAYPEPPMLDIADLEVEPAFAAPEGLTSAGGDVLGSSDDDEEIAWVAAEGPAEPDLVLEYDQLDESDDTEVLIAAEARDEDAAGELRNDDDFDLAFEPEEYDTPLRPHTGESLSVIAEEDALAGVHAGPWQDRSPFGDPLESTGATENEDASAAFEPLPESEIDASASDAPDLEGVFAEMDEMDAVPSSEPAAPSSGSGRDADPGAFDLGDAETLVDDASAAFAWDAGPAESVPETPSTWARQAPESSGTLTEWAPPSPEESAMTEDAGDAVHAHAPEVREETAAPGAEMQDVEVAEMPELAVAGEQPESAAPGERTSGEAMGSGAPAGQSAQDEVVVEASAAEADTARSAGAQAAAPVPDEPAAGEDPDTAPAETDGAASAFVTETMAQLYLQQGFRAEALEVYRKLAAQSPDDQRLRERIAELEGAARPDAASGAGDRSEKRTPGAHRTAASFFKGLASRPAPVAPPPAAVEPTDFGTWVDEALSESGEISDADRAAATALANGFSPEVTTPVDSGAATRAADRDMSLNDVFGARQRSASGTASASMDAFFTPEGEREHDASASADSPEDLEAFNAWLEGLKK